MRFLKDPQRLHNYQRSLLAEQMVAAPRNKWLTTPDAVKGHEVKWRRAPTSDDPFLYFNDGEQPPQHIPPPGIDAALVNEAMTETGSVPASLAMKGLCELPGLKALPQVPAMTALAATAG